MADRFTFDEIKNFKVGDEFWKNGESNVVSTDPRIQTIEFYGATHQKIEWDGYCAETGRETRFGVADNDNPFGDDTYLIFKSSASHNIEGTSNEVIPRLSDD